MRVLLDTNVWIAGLISRGQCAELIEHCIGEHEVVTSDWIVSELRGVLDRRFGYSSELLDRTDTWIHEVADVTQLKGSPPELCRDPDDNWVLLSAAESKADVLVSGDSDLLDLERYSGISIIAPRDFWRLENRRGTPPGP